MFGWSLSKIELTLCVSSVQSYGKGSKLDFPLIFPESKPKINYIFGIYMMFLTGGNPIEFYHNVIFRENI